MSKRQHLVGYLNPVLYKPTKEIVAFDSHYLQELADNMFEIMYDNNGVGLAANQIGLNSRICVLDPTGKRKAQMILINPQIVKKEGYVCSPEQCLSLPGEMVLVDRAKRVTVEFQTVSGEEVTHCANGFLALILQHEIDHLDGILMTDRKKGP